jgi:hypothetical protein
MRKKMTDVDPELLRLKEIERRAHERFLRLGESAGLSGYGSIIKAAEDIWIEAASAVRAYQEREGD